MLKGLLAQSVEMISCRELNERKNQFVILDTRAENEKEISHIEGAVWVGYAQFDLSSVSHIAKEKPIVVYCSVGYRSEKIGEQLLRAGFMEVYNLNGGIFEWVNQGFPVVKNDNRPTEEIHGYSKVWAIWLKKGKIIH